MNEILRHDNRSENTSNGLFHFSVNITRFKFQSMGFLMHDFFASFIGKPAEAFISTALSSKIPWFYWKTRNVSQFSVIKISTRTNFIHLRSKLTSEICQKARRLDGKMSQNRFKMCVFSFFSRKTTIFKEKRETVFSFLF